MSQNQSKFCIAAIILGVILVIVLVAIPLVLVLRFYHRKKIKGAETFNERGMHFLKIAKCKMIACEPLCRITGPKYSY